MATIIPCQCFASVIHKLKMFDRDVTSIWREKYPMRCIIHALIFCLLIVAGFGQKDLNNFGPYVMTWEALETCKGPKQSDCGKFNIANSQNMSDVVFLLDFPKDCPATMAKIVVSTKSNNITKRLWNYVLNQPCDHFVLGPILVDSFNLTKSCKINKGRYEVHLDLAAKAKMFLGTRFFYGTYTFTTMSYNKINNFFCVKSVLDVKQQQH